MDRLNICKIILAASLTFSTGPAMAEDMLMSANQVNGFIVLTDEICSNNPQGRIAKATDETGQIVMWGCCVMVTPFTWKINWNNGMEVYIDPTQDQWLSRVKTNIHDTKGNKDVSFF